MLSKTTKRILFATAAATSVMMSAHAAQAQSITVYVAANFIGALQQLEDQYSNDFPSGTYTFTNIVGATGDLTTGIERGGYTTTSGTLTTTAPQADLFLAANTPAIHSLVSSYSSLLTYFTTVFTSGCVTTSTCTTYGWIYAEGYLELYSNSTQQVVSSTGLPAGGPTYTLSPTLVIAKPSSAPYGYAALQLLNHTYGYGYSSSSAFPTTATAGIATAANIDATYQAVLNQTFSWGFVALSEIATYDPDSFTLTYTPDSQHHFPFNPGPTTYDPILQGAVKVSAGTGSATLRDSFVAWLGTRDAQSILLQYGYTIPYPIATN